MKNKRVLQTKDGQIIFVEAVERTTGERYIEFYKACDNCHPDECSNQDYVGEGDCLEVPFWAMTDDELVAYYNESRLC